MVAVQVRLQQRGITSAKFRFVDSANWDLAWSALSSMAYIRHDKANLRWQNQDWWHQLAKAGIIIGWYAHEVLSSKLNVSMLENLVENGAVILLGCPAAGPCYFAQQAAHPAPNLKVTYLGQFGREKGFLFSRRQDVGSPESSSPEAAITEMTLDVGDPMSIRSYLLDAFFSALKKETSLQPANVPLYTDIKTAMATIDAQLSKHVSNVQALEHSFKTPAKTSAKVPASPLS
ncbi:hypothetical protein WJX82_006720 [Trebouxia sp. C0006]